MRLVVSKTTLYFSLVVFFLFGSNSTGFDFYAHSVSYYFYSQDINHKDILFDVVILPRYLLLSYVYEFFSRVGIPLGWISLLLMLIPFLAILDSQRQLIKKGTIRLNAVILILFCLLLCVYYSGLSLVILWFIAFFCTRKRYFLIGCLFHPVGFFISLFMLFILNDSYFKLLFLFFTMLMFFYFSNYIGLFTASDDGSFRFRISFDSFLNILTEVFMRKSQEIIALLLIAVLSYFAKSKFKFLFAFFRRVSIPFGLFKFSILIPVIMMLFIMHGKQTLINSIFSLEVNNVIYASWFDIGSKDLLTTYGILYGERYR